MATRVFGAVAGNWNTDALWVGGVKPTAADDVTLTVASANVTIDAASVCRSLDCTGYTGVLTHNAFTLTIGDATAGAGNIALKLVSSMTYTLTDPATSAITFASTSATQQTVDCGGKTVGNVTFGTSGTPNYVVISGLASGATATVTSTFGHLHLDGVSDNSGLTHNIGKFAATASNVRTINLGAATINLSGTSTNWNMSTTTNITLSQSGSSITSLGSTGGQTITFNGGNKNYGSLTLQGANESSVSGNNTFVNLTRNGTSDAASRNALQLNLPFSGTTTITGAFTVTGEGATKRALVWPSSNALPTTIVITGATLNLQYVDFQDVIFNNGGNNVDLSAITGGSGDAGGNSIAGGGTLTFTPATTQTWQTTGAGNVSDVTKWTSRIPLPQDTVVFNSAFVGSPVISVDMLFSLGSVDLSTSTGTMTFRAEWLGTNLVGDVKLRSGATMSNSASCSFYLNARGANTLTFNGGTLSATLVVSSGNGGNLTIADSGNHGAQLQHRSGTITVPAGVTFGVDTYVSNATSTSAKSIVVINGTFNLRGGTGTIFSMTNSATFTSIQGGGTLGITSTNASSKTFAGGGNSYPTVAITGSGAGAIIITGANTFNKLTVIGGTKSITLPGSTTTTILQGTDLGNTTNIITFTASAGSATLAKATGMVDWDYVNLTNIVSSGTPYFFAGSHSTNGGGNTGWIFIDAPPQSGGGALKMGISI